jgi:hypothetical protein
VVTDPAGPDCRAVLTVHPEGVEEVTVRVDKSRVLPAIAVSCEFLEQKFTGLADSTFTDTRVAAIITAALAGRKPIRRSAGRGLIPKAGCHGRRSRRAGRCRKGCTVMADQGRLVSAAGQCSVQNGRGVQQQDDAHNGYFCGGLMGSRGASPVTPGRPARSGDGCRRDG